MNQESRSVAIIRSNPTYFLLPAILGSLTAVVVPLVSLILLGFTSWDLIQPLQWVGMANFGNLAGDESFLNSLRATVGIGTLSTVFVVALGLLLGYFLSSWSKTSRVLSVIFLIPWMAAPVAVAILWKWILTPTGGVLSNALGFRLDLLTNPVWAPVVIAGVFTWTGAGYVALLISSGLRSLPKNLIEAARIDGASDSRVYWYIQLPLIRRVILFVVVTVSLQALSLYDIVYILTGGGPQGATDVATIHIVDTTLNTFQLGLSSAMSLGFIGLELGVVAVELWIFTLLTRRFDD